MRKGPFHMLVATDASPEARAAMAASLAFPWPDRTRALGVMVTGVPALTRWRRGGRTALLAWLRREAVRVRRTLKRRWADADVVVVDPPAVAAIVERARAQEPPATGGRPRDATRRRRTDAVNGGSAPARFRPRGAGR
jgi:hypothetical protein